MMSAAEAELGGFCLNAIEEAPICTIFEEMKGLQTPTPIHVDKYTALGIINEFIKQKCSNQWTWDLTGSLIELMVANSRYIWNQER